jgi:hypothetical protein
VLGAGISLSGRHIYCEFSHQIENEYGSYKACDSNYTTRLRNIFRNIVGDAAVLYTTDGSQPSYLRCGKIEGVYATVDFGTGNRSYSCVLCFFLCSFLIYFLYTKRMVVQLLIHMY